jgi:hypothetical protein
MRVLHSATRALALAALAALAVGCSKDSTGPADSPFDPAGTSSDLSAVNSSFDSPALLSFSAASDEISLTTGGAAALALQARPSAALAGGKASALRYAGALAKTFTRGPAHRWRSPQRRFRPTCSVRPLSTTWISSATRPRT